MVLTFLGYLRRREWVFLGLFAFLTVQAQADSHSPDPLSNQAIQLTVPFEKQETPRQCGLAAVKMITDFYGQKISDVQTDWLKSDSEAGDGLLGSELVVVLRAAGYDTALFEGSLDNEKTGLYYHLGKHRPLIVMIASKDGKNSHYDVVTGYNPAESTITLLDPAVGPVTVSGKRFLSGWLRANYFTLLAVPKKPQGEKTPTK